jgi:hypothetical protein
MKFSLLTTAALACALSLSLSACNRHSPDSEPSQTTPSSTPPATPMPAGTVPAPGSTAANPA